MFIDPAQTKRVLGTGDILPQAFNRIEVLENITKINQNLAQPRGGVEMDVANSEGLTKARVGND